jgi:RNA polymerase sigma-70 factor (ECF subfamily)
LFSRPKTTDTIPETLPDWAILAEGIRRNDETAVKQFYEVFNRGFRYFIRRQLGPSDLEDSVHDCVLAVIKAVREGAVHEPARFVGFVNTIVRRHIAHKIREKVSGRTEDDIESIPPLRSLYASPESDAIQGDARVVARRVLDTLGDRDRDVLRRFYVLDQTEDQICRELDLSSNGFRNVKHRAKKKFAEHWHRLADRGFRAVLPARMSLAVVT